MKVVKSTKKNSKVIVKPTSETRTMKPVTSLAPVASAPVKAAAAPKAIPAATKTITTIEAKIDVGFGNSLYVRGEGAGLSWERGTPLKCVDPQTWQWSAEATNPLKVKLLLNDAVWMAGEDLVIPAGKRVEISPAF